MAAGGSGIFKRSTGLNGIKLGLNPFIPAFIIYPKIPKSGDKMAAPGKDTKLAGNATSSALFDPKR